MGAPAREQDPRIWALRAEVNRVLELGDRVLVALAAEGRRKAALHIPFGHALEHDTALGENVLVGGVVELDEPVVTPGRPAAVGRAAPS
jgi:hypothetical protein